jgi:glycosyltransferase involved in cell wall biosynthesis
MNATRSILGQMVGGIQVLISDNSTSANDRAQLGSFCQKLADTRLRYILPPVPMSMPNHWDWALRQALESYEANHFVFLTDRMMFKPRSVKSVVEIVQLYPDRIIAYGHDMIDDDQRPIRVEQYPWTGKVFEVSCLRLSYLYSQCYTHYGLPRMLNSVAPRKVLEDVRERFGNYFGSIAPDMNFGFRCLEVCDSILVYDRSPIFHYALDRSNGASQTRGELTRDNLDFVANLPVNNSGRNYATPIPPLLLTGNAIMNEYCIVKQEAQSSRFFEIDMTKYLARMAMELDLMVDSKARAEAERLLIAHGWQGYPPRQEFFEQLRSLTRKVRSRSFPRKLLNRLRREMRRPFTERFWLFLARNFGVQLPGDHRLQFSTVEEAIEFVCDFPRRRSKGFHENAEILQATEVPALLTPPGSSSLLERSRRLAKLAPPPVRVFLYRILSLIQLTRLGVARRLFPIRWRTARHFGLGRKPQGVNLVADARSALSGGVIARGVAVALELAEIPFDIIGWEPRSASKNEDTSFLHKEVRRPRYDISVVCTNPDGLVHLKIHLPRKALGNCYVILYSFWELPDFPEAWLHAFDVINEYWAGSRFIQEAVALKSPVPVVRIPPVVQLKATGHFSREEFGLPEGRFLFLTMAETGSVLERKNPLGVIKAFKKAFAGKDSSVGLVVKLSSFDRLAPTLWQSFLEEIGDYENVFMLPRALRRDEASSLIAQSECYVSLHRSEGFGLGPAEAMSLGKPAILTNWSGNTDYMTKDNSIGIDYELVKVGKDYGPYKHTQYWAEPDIEHAAYWMKRIYQEPELARSIGLRGKETICSEYSGEAVGKLIRRRLEYIRRYA